jgi:hypothetical protein
LLVATGAVGLGDVAVHWAPTCIRQILVSNGSAQGGE